MEQVHSFNKSQPETNRERPANIGSIFDAAQFRQLIDRLSWLAEEMQGRVAETPPARAYADDGSPLIVENLRAMIRSRVIRAELFSGELFGDPAWDLLLNLYAMHLAQRRQSIGGIAHLSGVPATTTLRWLRKLESAGFVGLRDDPLDQRRIFAELTPAAVAAMERYFDRVSTIPARRRKGG